MPISNKRKTRLDGTTFALVAHPTEIRFTTNPATGEVSLDMQFMEMLMVDNVVARNVNFGRAGRVRRDWKSIKNIRPAYPGATDPVTGADLTQISFRGIAELLQDAFDRVYEADNP